jgi:hypothetical protein
MHEVAKKTFDEEVVKLRLLDDIGRTKTLTANASAAGVRPHTLPTRPKDIEDDGVFHYAVLGPEAASESGKPSPLAKRFLEETTGPDRPRVYRNSLLLLVPSKDGLELAMARVHDYLAWEIVREEIKKQQKDGNIDPAREGTLRINIEKGKGRIPEAIKQAYCIVVTVSEKDDVQAFKITVTEEPHFNLIKADPRSRIQDTAITAEALLPDGPYNLWRAGETSRRVKDLSGAFAQLAHLPKMLKTKAILDTLSDGCAQGIFVLKLTRPDGTSRTWWLNRPDETALNDSALELVLPEAAELGELSPDIATPKKLPGLWNSDEIAVQAMVDYFNGTNVVQVNRGGYQETMAIPKAPQSVVESAVSAAVENGSLWLLSGPASILAEPIPAGILNVKAKLCAPPAAITAAEILPENLPDAWKDSFSSGLSVATSLSQRAGKTLPWKTVRDVISAGLQARFLEIAEGTWPCDFPLSQFATFKVKVGAPPPPPPPSDSSVLVAEDELEAVQIQDLGDIIPKLLEIKAKANIPLRFHLRIELGDGKTKPTDEILKAVNSLLNNVKEGFEVE